jgi:hypothetical protein
MQVATNAQAIDAPADGGRPGLPTGRRRLPRLTLSGGKLLLSGGLIGYLLYRYGPDHARLERLDPILCTITVAIFVLQIALNTVRWRLIVRHIAGTDPPYYRLFGIYYARLFFLRSCRP